MKILDRKKLIYTICWSLIILMFLMQIVFSMVGLDWFSKKFYLLRCLQDLSVQALYFYFAYNLFKKNFDFSEKSKAIVRPYRIAEFILAVITILLSAFEVFRSNWMAPNNAGNDMFIFMPGIIFLFTVFGLEYLAVNPEKRKKKRYYIMLTVFAIIGIWMTSYGVIIWLEFFGVIK